MKATRKSHGKKVLVLLATAMLIAITSMPVAAAPAKNIPLTGISMSTAMTINVKASKKLTVTYKPANTTASKAITWKSSNTSIATVSGGTVVGRKAGTVTITAKCGNKTATCKVTVKNAARFLNVNECYNTLNTYRKNNKVAKNVNLKKDATLEKAAQTRAKELVSKFSHTRPNGKSGLSIISGNVYKGENIARGQKSCAAVMKAWYNSAGHKANMLRKDYTKVGIAGYEYNGTIYWVQLFSS